MPNLQKKRLLIFEIFNIKKCTLFFGTEYINQSIHASVCPTHTIHPSIQCPFFRPSNNLPARPLIHPSITYPFLRLQAFSSIHPTGQPASQSTNQPTCKLPRPDGCGERVGVMTWWLQVRSPVEVTFLSGVFSPLTCAEACEKSSRWLWKKKLC